MPSMRRQDFAQRISSIAFSSDRSNRIEKFPYEAHPSVRSRC